ncbi:hypothetical protein GNI_014860 [Gregarina niphandrodes]|uniref:Uncharacterized protein n=1 Tax=Gregarina niphandrodes TaxID=110365 RepID=A0A023BCB8_GRENI|nr:hypothetical protein GNI_014860 [Gregarina niphandrodes]EZG83324.1 hypothetical protein GNI_014860 [Gregarina niphandrodes]|eukprot:XP_011128948.1 hypothetical protein GNI_014860 [Gregarina niphandrodes]
MKKAGGLSRVRTAQSKPTNRLPEGKAVKSGTKRNKLDTSKTGTGRQPSEPPRRKDQNAEHKPKGPQLKGSQSKRPGSHNSQSKGQQLKRPQSRGQQLKGSQSKGPQNKGAKRPEEHMPEGVDKDLGKILKQVQASLDAQKVAAAVKGGKKTRIKGKGRFEVSDAKTLAAINSVRKDKTKKAQPQPTGEPTTVAARQKVLSRSKVEREGNPVFKALLQEHRRAGKDGEDEVVTETLEDIQRLMESLGDPLDPQNDEPGVLGTATPSRKGVHGEEQYIDEDDDFPSDFDETQQSTAQQSTAHGGNNGGDSSA